MQYLVIPFSQLINIFYIGEKLAHMKNVLSIIILSFLITTINFGQEGADTLIKDQVFSGLKWRNIGPAMTSGRIADIAIHPTNQNIMYVAVGSGNVWKTINAGTTWKPIFEKYSGYSIGCITLDPSNPHIVWLGTGENVGGRHVGFGDGIYKSMDGGNS